MELMDALRLRRAVRDFAETPVSEKEIRDLVQAAVLAPSAMNLQPWTFAATLDRKLIDSLAERGRQWAIENPAATGFGEDARSLLERPGFNIFYHAPALVLVIAQSSAAQAVEDCCLAAENLMLAARDRGIGSCWIGFSRAFLNRKEVKAELGLDERSEVVAPLILGYPKAWPETHGRKMPHIHWF
jgi:nitroreductase